MGEDEHGTFDVAAFAAELGGEPNTNVGTKLLLENDRVKIWEISLEPGDRAPFHWHAHTYFFVCVEAGRVRTHFPNGFYVDGDSEVGECMFMDHSAEEPGVHDLENIGTTTVRYTTVELLG